MTGWRLKSFVIFGLILFSTILHSMRETPVCFVNSHWEGDPMPVTYQFCWRKATECQRLADLEPAQSAARAFFIHSRDSWIVLANRLTVLGETHVATHEEAWDAIIFGQVA
jgi:hypothetical protein